jgi:predicted DCC family thiol-disulfide oxidoreductase YuxK
MSPKLTVWYNTKCPICNAGIAWQRNRLVRAARAGAIEFRDIGGEPDVLARFGAGMRAAGCTRSTPTAAYTGRRLRDRDLARNPRRRRSQDGDVGFGKAAKDELDCRSASSIRS